MHIPIFVNSLSRSELKELCQYLKDHINEEALNSEDPNIYLIKPHHPIDLTHPATNIITIADFMIKFVNSKRLTNILTKGIKESKFQYLTDITITNFLSCRNAGKKTWYEFTNAVKELLSDASYEQQWKVVYKHFKKNSRGHF